MKAIPFKILLLCAVLGVLPVLPIMLSGSPILNNDMLLAYYSYFCDFHKNWSWSHPLVFWTSSFQCGMPMHAYWQSAFLYPLTWILFGSISPSIGIYWFYAFHFALGIYGFILLGPKLHLHRVASLWGGIVFSLSGTMLARYEHITFLAGWEFIPLVLWAYLNLVERHNLSSIFIYALLVCMQTLGGHPQASVTTALLIFIFTLADLKRNKFSKKYITWISGGHLLAIIYCAPLVIPFTQFVDQTNRYGGVAWENHEEEPSAAAKLQTGVFSFTEFSTGGIRPLHALSLIAPHALGTPSQATWWGGEVWGEVFVYMGGLGFFFCFFASYKRANKYVQLILGMGLVGLWLASGKHLGASQVLYHLPVWNNFRRPARYLILVVFALAVLSAHGLQRWMGKKQNLKPLLYLLALALLGEVALLLLRNQFENLLHWLEQLRGRMALNPQKDYTEKMQNLLQGWTWDGVFILISVGSLFYVTTKAKTRYALLFIILLIDLLRIHWSHFYRFPATYYREPPASMAALDTSHSYFWRIAANIEYQGLEFWQMHNNPTQHIDLFEREKTALTYGIHAVFGIRSTRAHLPTLWKWNGQTHTYEKAGRYFLSNVELQSVYGKPLQKLARFDSVYVYEFKNWLPRYSLNSVTSTGSVTAKSVIPVTEPVEVTCPQGYQGLRGLCVYEKRDDDIYVQSAVAGTLVFRERYYSEWRYRENHGPWQKPKETSEHFMEATLMKAGELEWEYIPFMFYYTTGFALAVTALFLGFQFSVTRGPKRK